MAADSYIFVGPTISTSEAEQWLQATYLPPASQGDIVSLLGKQPRIIGIIDGYFERVPAVWHKEILLAMSEGVHVVGSASMGALRAAELHRFGMVGIGEIFAWYRDGLIEADDEVAVRHMPAEYGYRPASEALVNIRRTLQLACEQGIIQPGTRHKLVEIGRQTHYGQRSYSLLLQQAARDGLPKGELAALERFLADETINLKKNDAVQMLQYVAELEKQSHPLNVDYNLNMTQVLVRLADKDFCLAHVDGIRLTADMLVNYARLAWPDFLVLQARALHHAQLLARAEKRGVTVSSAEYRETVTHLRHTFVLEDEVALEGWMAHQHLSPAEFETFVNEWACIRKMSAEAGGETPEPKKGVGRNDPSSYAANRHIIRQIRISGEYEKLVRSVIAKEKYFREKAQEAELFIDERHLYQFYFHERKIDLPQDIGQFAAHLGFSDKDVFRMELLKYYYYQQHRRQAMRQWFETLRVEK